MAELHDQVPLAQQSLAVAAHDLPDLDEIWVSLVAEGRQHQQLPQGLEREAVNEVIPVGVSPLVRCRRTGCSCTNVHFLAHKNAKEKEPALKSHGGQPISRPDTFKIGWSRKHAFT